MKLRPPSLSLRWVLFFRVVLPAAAGLTVVYAARNLRAMASPFIASPFSRSFNTLQTRSSCIGAGCQRSSTCEARGSTSGPVRGGPHVRRDDAEADENAVATVVFQSVPNAVAGGMLAHIGYDFLKSDFTDEVEGRGRKLWLLATGGFLMCFLAIWA